MSSIIKLAALAASLFGPFSAGYLITFTRAPEAAIFFGLAGCGLGLGGLFVFAALERGERETHLRALRGSEPRG